MRKSGQPHRESCIFTSNGNIKLDNTHVTATATSFFLYSHLEEDEDTELFLSLFTSFEEQMKTSQLCNTQP